MAQSGSTAGQMYQCGKMCEFGGEMCEKREGKKGKKCHRRTCRADFGVSVGNESAKNTHLLNFGSHSNRISPKIHLIQNQPSTRLEWRFLQFS